MKPSSNASQQANQWALKKKEQMEKAAQMRAERKLAATGEMALGTKTNYVSKDYDKPPSQNSQKQYYQSDLGNNNVRQQQYGQQQFQMNDIGFQNVQPNRQSSLGKQQPQPSYDKYGYNQNPQFTNNKPPSQEGQRRVQQGIQQKPQMNQGQQNRQQYGKIDDDYDYQNRQYGQIKQQQQQPYNAKQPPPVQKQQQYRPPSGTYDQSNSYNKPSNQAIKPPVQSTKQSTNNKQQSNLRNNQQPSQQPQQQYCHSTKQNELLLKYFKTKNKYSYLQFNDSFLHYQVIQFQI